MKLVPFRKRPNSRKLKTSKYHDRWAALQRHCATRKTWPQAINEADDLLCEALKQKHYKGKTTGERLVAAQHDLTANDLVWFGHKLREKIIGQDVRTLKKQDILEALAGFRQALRDLGALEK
jgi:hypothetical protein